MPIYKGDLLPHAIQRVGVRGADITNHLSRWTLDLEIFLRKCRLLQVQNLKPSIVQKLKESACRVAPIDYEDSLRTATEKGFKLPDGQIIKMRTEGLTAAEAMFQVIIAAIQNDNIHQPTLILENKESPGIHEAAYAAIQKVDIDFRKELMNNVVLSGGNTMFPGFEER